MNNYIKGARLERLARASLQRHGYRVIRSAGSKGAVDLAAFNREHVLLVQVKADRITPADRRKLVAFPAPPNARKQFWRRTSDGWEVIEVEATDTGAPFSIQPLPAHDLLALRQAIRPDGRMCLRRHARFRVACARLP